MKLSRRNLVKGAAAGAAGLGFPLLNTGVCALQAGASRTYSVRALDLVHEALVIDMLALIALDYRPEVYAKPLTPKAIADLRASGITGFHQSVGTMGPSAREDTLAFFSETLSVVGRHGDLLMMVDKAQDLQRAKQAGKIAIILGVQNSEHFRDADDVKLFYQLGQRCSQLTYNAQNLLGSGSTERVDGGVTDRGETIIKAMNDVGMLIDVSHCGPRTTLDAIALSPKPIAITHSNCRAILDHPRNKTDEAIKALAAKGGVMGITGVRNFVNGSEPTGVAQIVDHIDHVAKLVGIEHVGLGSDSDLNGYDDLPPEIYAQLKASYKASYAFRGKIDTDGFDHPLKVFDLTEELIRRRYSDANIRAVLGGNFLRLLTGTWA